VVELVSALRQRRFKPLPRRHLMWSGIENLAYPLVVLAVADSIGWADMPMAVQILFTMAITVPLGIMMYRIAFQPMAEASVLVLLIVSVGVHFALLGLGLFIFGPEGFTTRAFTDWSTELGAMLVSGQSLVVIGVSALMIGGLYVFFDRSLYGKALRATAVNRKGAQLVGIGTTQAGRMPRPAAWRSASPPPSAPSRACSSGRSTRWATTPASSSPSRALSRRSSAGSRAARELPAGCRRRTAGRPARELLLLLGERLQGSHRLHADHSGARLAFADLRPWRRRMKHISTKKLQWLLFGWFFVFPFLPVPPYWITIGNYIGLYSIVTVGLVLLTGIGGLTSFGQAAFVGIGAYTTAYLSSVMGWSPWIGLPAGLVAAGLTAALIGGVTVGGVTVRLSGHFLPLATIAWALSLYYLFGTLEFLGKYDGLSGIPSLSLFGYDLSSPRVMYGLIWLCLGGCLWLILNLLNSRPGRAIRALAKGPSAPWPRARPCRRRWASTPPSTRS